MPTQRIAAVILAAGLSRRMGLHKLLMVSQGRALIAHSVDKLLASSVDEVWVVTGHGHERIRQALAERSVNYVHCDEFQQGMGRSIATGIEALSQDIHGALICLGDMPRVSTNIVNDLIESFQAGGWSSIVVPVHQGRRGHPVVFPRDVFPSMVELRGDTGARVVVQKYAERVLEVEVKSDGVLIDVDDRHSAQEMGFDVEP